MRIDMEGWPRRIAAAATAALAASSFAAAEVNWDTADSKWRQGPVKYLLTKEEDQAYKKLKTDAERQQYVDQFWQQRDPTPGTPDNEYRDAFYRLAREAAARFSEEGGKGWQDDRGRVFILLGPPDQQVAGSSLLGASAEGSAGAANPAGGGGFGGSTSAPRSEEPRKTVQFVYLENPITGKGRLELNFTSDVTGGYRLQERIDWNHPFLRGLAQPPKTAAAPAPASGAVPPDQAPPSSEAPSTPAVPAPAAIPQPETTVEYELMQQIKSAPDLTTALPLDVTANFYKAADKSTFATLTLEVKRSALPATSDPDALVLAAEIVNAANGESTQRFFKQGQFTPFEGNAAAGINDTLLYQAERPLNPGKYKATFVVKDPASGGIGKLERELDVPEFQEDTLALSTVTLARKIEPLEQPAAPGSPVPFVLGKLKVVPRPDNTFKKDEEISFYYQVYGAAVDPATSQPKLDLSYAFEMQREGVWQMKGGRPVTQPAQSGLVQALTIPMKGWPAGEWRLTIQVTDTLSGKTASSQIGYTIAGAVGGSKAKAKSKG